MRPTPLCRKLTGIESLYANRYQFGEKGIVFDVRPRKRTKRCGCCGESAPGYDRQPERTWRCESYGDIRILLRYAPWRVDCPRCGVHVEAVPWARHGSRFTRDFEEKVGYLAIATNRTAVTELMGISWRTVGRIIETLVAEKLDPNRFKGLRAIGVDEFSYRKRHNHITLVIDHDAQLVIWAAEGRSAEVLEEWLAWTSRSKLAPFVKVARTIRQYKEGILAYIRDRLTNGFVEGINNKLRVVTRRAFGFHSAEALISMLFLNCGGDQSKPQAPMSPQKRQENQRFCVPAASPRNSERGTIRGPVAGRPPRPRRQA